MKALRLGTLNFRLGSLVIINLFFENIHASQIRVFTLLTDQMFQSVQTQIHKFHQNNMFKRRYAGSSLTDPSTSSFCHRTT